MATLDLTADVVTLTQQLVDIFSVSHEEQEIADAVEAALLALPHLTVTRRGHTIVARTDLGRGERVVIAGHLDTVPLNDNLPSRLEDGILHGLGSCDMKGGDAVMLKLAADVTEPNRDLTFIFYEAEEVDSVHNGLRKLTESDPELLRGRLRDPDGAEQRRPSRPAARARCASTYAPPASAPTAPAAGRASTPSTSPAPVLARLNDYVAHQPEIDGLTYHEGLNATGIRGGVAGNVIPDECVVEVNFRFAPDRSEADAEAFVRDFFEGYDVTVTDIAAGAMPGPRPPGGEGVRRRRRRRGQPEVRLDRRRAVHQARRPGGQLRPRRPDVRPQAGRARPHRAHRALRADPQGVAGMSTPIAATAATTG